MTKEELKQMLVDNVTLYVQLDKDNGEIVAKVSIYFENEEILSGEYRYTYDGSYESEW